MQKASKCFQRLRSASRNWLAAVIVLVHDSLQRVAQGGDRAVEAAALGFVELAVHFDTEVGLLAL